MRMLCMQVLCSTESPAGSAAACEAVIRSCLRGLATKTPPAALALTDSPAGSQPGSKPPSLHSATMSACEAPCLTCSPAEPAAAAAICEAMQAQDQDTHATKSHSIVAEPQAMLQAAQTGSDGSHAASSRQEPSEQEAADSASTSQPAADSVQEPASDAASHASSVQTVTVSEAAVTSAAKTSAKVGVYTTCAAQHVQAHLLSLL